MVIFSENTLHGTLPWQAGHDRRALLYRYTPKYLHYAGGTYEVNQPAWVSELTEAQQAVLEPPYIYHHPSSNRTAKPWSVHAARTNPGPSALPFQIDARVPVRIAAQMLG